MDTDSEMQDFEDLYDKGLVHIGLGPDDIMDMYNLQNKRDMISHSLIFFEKTVRGDLERKLFDAVCITIQTGAKTMTTIIAGGYDAEKFVQNYRLYSAKNCAACGKCGNCSKCKFCIKSKEECECRNGNYYCTVTRDQDHRGTFTDITNSIGGVFKYEWSGGLGVRAVHIEASLNPYVFFLGGFKFFEERNDIFVYNYKTKIFVRSLATTHIKGALKNAVGLKPCTYLDWYNLISGFCAPNSCKCNQIYIKMILSFIDQPSFYGIEITKYNPLETTTIPVSIIESMMIPDNNYDYCPSNWICKDCGQQNVSLICRFCPACGKKNLRGQHRGFW